MSGTSTLIAGFVLIFVALTIGIAAMLWRHINSQADVEFWQAQIRRVCDEGVVLGLILGAFALAWGLL